MEHRGRGRSRQRRRQSGKLTGPGEEAGPEGAAPCAIAQVGSLPASTQHPLVAVGERGAHGATGHVASLAILQQRAACFEDRRLHNGRAHAEHLGDLVVRKPAELAQHQCRALTLGQPRKVHLELTQRFPLGVTFLGRRRRGQLLHQLRRLPALAHQVDAFVVRHTEQPRPQLEVAFLRGQCPVGLDHRVLQRVLRVLLVAQDREAVAVQLLVMAVVQLGERRFAAHVARAQARGPAQTQSEGALRGTARRRAAHVPCIDNVRHRL